MKLSLHGEAVEEAEAHIAWYREQSERAAVHLSERMSAALVEIAAGPLQFSLMEWRRNPGNIRRVHIRSYPILIVYEVLSDEVFVVAIAHSSQRMGYWRSRLRST